MPDSQRPSGNRRDFLTGRAVRQEVEWIGDQAADRIAEGTQESIPAAGPTVRLGTTAMAADFVVMLNPGPAEHVHIASTILEETHDLEQAMTVYREEGELAQWNLLHESGVPSSLSTRLIEVVQRSQCIAEQTHGAYDHTSGPLIELWRDARQNGRIPTESEISETLNRCGYRSLTVDAEHNQMTSNTVGLELNLGGIGKGFALDCLGRKMAQRKLDDWLMHGGRSSLLASGRHGNLKGWPVGVRHPLFPGERLATILLRNQAMSTSGAGIQFFRHEGKRYGHILDPRTGWPAENVLSVTVLAPSAAEADALSTAFFVMGLEKTREYCDNHPEIAVLMIPPPQTGRQLNVHTFNLPEQTLFLQNEDDQIS